MSDPRGSITDEIVGGVTVRHNVWDLQNRLRECTNNGVTSAFTYGADGLRRSMTVGGNPTVHYALDGQSVAQEGHLDNGDFVADVTYLTGPRGPEYKLDNATNEVKWYIFDGLGSVVAEADDNGNVSNARAYDVYGIPRGGGTSSTKHGFVGNLGHTTEPDTGGLVYMRARWMDPLTGRFISEDPANNGVNWFTYCGNNPVNLVDNNGKNPYLIAGALIIIGALVGLGYYLVSSGINGQDITLSGAGDAALAGGLTTLATILLMVVAGVGVPMLTGTELAIATILAMPGGILLGIPGGMLDSTPNSWENSVSRHIMEIGLACDMVDAET